MTIRAVFRTIDENDGWKTELLVVPHRGERLKFTSMNGFERVYRVADVIHTPQEFVPVELVLEQEP